MPDDCDGTTIDHIDGARGRQGQDHASWVTLGELIELGSGPDMPVAWLTLRSRLQELGAPDGIRIVFAHA